MSENNQIKELASKIAEEIDGDIFLINGEMESVFARDVCNEIELRAEKKSSLLFLLVTNGGDPDAAYRIARSIQRNYRDSTAIVAGWCKSAGTLVCIAGNKLVMGSHGELGPLDVQLIKPDDLGGRASGLTIDSAFRSLRATSFQMFEQVLLETIKSSGGRITTKTAAEIASGLTTGLLSPIFSQIDPNKVGDDYRSTLIADAYARRLNIQAKNMRVTESFDAIDMLVRGFPSHSFVVDLEEAKRIFARVTTLEGNLKELVDSLGDSCMVPVDARPISCYLNESAGAEADGESDGSESKPSKTRSSKTST